MNLAPDLFDRRFRDFMDLGRARLRALAPSWTDHNAHDPGITFMELLAWVAEAQLFALSRQRKDERASYAAMFGIHPTGTRPATGLIWPDQSDLTSPAATVTGTRIISKDAAIKLTHGESPLFRCADRILWAPGEIQSLRTRSSAGVTDHTAVNGQGRTAFAPFGPSAGIRDVLELTFLPRDSAGLFGSDRASAMGARWTLGVRVAAAALSTSRAQDDVAMRRSPLEASLAIGNRRYPVQIVADTTRGLLATGVIVMDLDEVPSLGREAVTLSLRAPRGLPRPPLVVRMEPNVIPIVQGRRIEAESHEVATSLPDLQFTLAEAGLRTDANAPFALEVAAAGSRSAWTQRRLTACGPTDEVFELDAVTGTVTFGNGVNGRIPSAEAQVIVRYEVCDGDRGNIARNRSWSVSGFVGTFGVNPDPIVGGEDAPDHLKDRRKARKHLSDEHALVSDRDIVDAAIALPHLDVARAWVTRSAAREPHAGAVTLVAMRRRINGVEPIEVPETDRWLDAIRRQLAPRMLLGTRLTVRRPRYAPFSVRAIIETNRGLDPNAVRRNIDEELSRRLALVSPDGATPAREPGVPLSRRDMVSWIRRVEGVSRVVELQLRDAPGTVSDTVKVTRAGLPRRDTTRDDIVVRRPVTGADA